MHVSSNRERFGGAAGNAAAREVVFAVRRKLVAMFAELGAVHLQLGKVYDFADRVDPGAYDLATAIKAVLDPKRRLNPGNLGWG